VTYKCETPACTEYQTKDYRFCESCLDDRNFHYRWGKTKEMVNLEMALNRKELRTLTHKTYLQAQRKAEEEAYEVWAQKNTVVPTMKGDPDFGPSIADKLQGLPEPGYGKMKADYEKFIEAKFQGEEKPLQSLSQSYIEMVTTAEDADNLKKSMDILFPEEEDGS